MPTNRGAAVAALADAVAARRGVHRTVKVANPKANIPNPTGKGIVQTNAATIESYLKDICSEGSVTVDAASGNVSITASFCNPAPVPACFVGPGRADGQDVLDARGLWLSVRHGELGARVDDRGRRRGVGEHQVRRPGRRRQGPAGRDGRHGHRALAEQPEAVGHGHRGRRHLGDAVVARARP